MANPFALQQALAKPEKPARDAAPDLPFPLIGEYRDLPARIVTFSEWDSVQSVQAAIIQLEFGIFQSAALLADSIARDDRVEAVLDTFIGGLLGLPFSIKAAGGEEATAAANKVAEVVGDDWPTMVPMDQLVRWITNGEMLGLGVGELTWKKESMKWTPTLKVHHNQFVLWNWESRTYQFMTQDGQVPLLPDDTHWALYTPGGYDYGWMYGLIRSIWVQWLVRQFTYRDWARYSEVHGLPIRGAIMPADATDAEKRSYLRDIAQVGAETAIALKQAKDGDKFDLKLIEAVANSEQSFDKLIQRAEESIAIRVLGQNLSTQVRGGSFAAAQVHENVRQDKKQAFATRVSRNIKSRIFLPYTAYNYGKPELTPDPAWNTTPPPDETAEANKMDVHATSLVNFKAGGIAVDVLTYCKRYNIPLDPKFPDGKLPEPVDPNAPGSPAKALPRRVPPQPPSQK